MTVALRTETEGGSLTSTKTNQSLFKAVEADPPWPIKGKLPYKTMSLEAIKAMPIAELMAPDSWCFLWIPNSLVLDEGAAVLRAWGFEPTKQFITWVKLYTLGLGEPLRNTTEQLLVGRRGKPVTHFRGQPTHLIAPRQGHSVKPEEQIAIVERLIGPEGLILELFARRRPTSNRWLIWGLEAPGGSDITIPGYPVPPKPGSKSEATKDGIPTRTNELRS